MREYLTEEQQCLLIEALGALKREQYALAEKDPYSRKIDDLRKLQGLIYSAKEVIITTD